MIKRAEENGVIITASEISQYAFCPLSWQLARAGIKPGSPRLLSGKRMHQRMGREISNMQKRENASQTFRILGHLSGLGAILLSGWLLFNQI